MLDKSWLVVIAVIAGLGSARAAMSQQSFLIRNTGDLADLCSAPQTDPLHTAAVNFCEGFGLGVFETLYEADAARRTKTICLPNPAPSRDQAVAEFVQWAKADPSRLTSRADDGVAAFIAQQYPCTQR